MPRLLTPPAAAAEPLVITADTRLAPGTHYLPAGIVVAADGVTLDGPGAVLVGAGGEGRGITVAGRRGVTVRGLGLRDYYHGVWARDCPGLCLDGNHVRGTAELAPGTVFLDIWLGPEAAYGGAFFLWGVHDGRVRNNDLQHQQNGLLTYSCRRLEVSGNRAGYNSGFGFHLHDTCESRFTDNNADFCCRFEPRPGGGRHHGHMGADAAGFLAVRGSSRNVFRGNAARLGGDGFFLAGLGPDGAAAGCDDNLFEENDGSWSPNIAFEATFCRGNVFRNNRAARCNYGFWLGFSRDALLEGNVIEGCRQAGIAVENGRDCQVRANRFERNGHGVLLWSRHVPAFLAAFPDRLTSRDWLIEDNGFAHHDRAVRIAANQDHGVRPLPPDSPAGGPETRPHAHTLRRNDIRNSRIGVECLGVEAPILEGNTFAGSLVADVVERE